MFALGKARRKAGRQDLVQTDGGSRGSLDLLTRLGLIKSVRIKTMTMITKK